MDRLPGVDINPGESKGYSFEVKLSIEEVGQDIQFYTVADVEGNEFPDNNTSAVITSRVIRSAYPSATNLEGAFENEQLMLQWDAP